MATNITPLVSIIIPAYNVGDYIKPCIESCLNQDAKAIEIIVINDGSTDETPKIVNELSSSQSNIKLINKPNGGVTAARQTGLARASAEYIFFLDGDDRLCEPDTITKLLNRAQKTNADYVAGDFIIVYQDDKRRLHQFPHYDIHNSEEALAYAFLNNDFYYTGRLIRRSLVADVNDNIPRDITYVEDTYAVVNLLTKIRIATKIDTPILEYVQRADSVTNRLSVYDLLKRNKSTMLTLRIAELMNFDRFAHNAIIIYALRELYQSIALGVPNREVADKYLKGYHYYSKEVKQKLGCKANTILLLASVNMAMTCKAIQLLKLLR